MHFRRCCTEERTGPQNRERGRGDANKDGDGDGNYDENGNGDEDGGECGGEREPGNRLSDGRSEVEDAREGVTLPHGPTPQRDRRIMRRTSGESQDQGGAEEGRRSARNPRRVMNAMRKTRETWAVGEKNVDKRALLQEMSIENI